MVWHHSRCGSTERGSGGRSASRCRYLEFSVGRIDLAPYISFAGRQEIFGISVG
jgi:hypothetical protein